MTPELKQQYDALTLAANTVDADGRWDAEPFVAAWNALPEGLRRYIDFQITDDVLLPSICREQFTGHNGDPTNPSNSEQRFFEKWETNVAQGYEVWKSRSYATPKEDKTLLVSMVAVAAKLAAHRAALIRGDTGR
jgi:hypothetical protein